MPKRVLPPIERLSEETQALFNVLNDEPDLAVILVATSFLDACLGSILERKLIRSSVTEKLLDPRSGALGTYSSRANVCYALGLINKALYQDLMIIGEIRNEIAHYHLALNFEAEPVRSKCAKLAYVASLKNGNTDEPLVLDSWMKSPRDQFVMTTVMLNQRLLLIGLGITTR
jgi:DNA-binding MltR family transcriptional regulator